MNCLKIDENNEKCEFVESIQGSSGIRLDSIPLESEYYSPSETVIESVNKCENTTRCDILPKFDETFDAKTKDISDKIDKSITMKNDEKNMLIDKMEDKVNQKRLIQSKLVTKQRHLSPSLDISAVKCDSTDLKDRSIKSSKRLNDKNTSKPKADLGPNLGTMAKKESIKSYFGPQKPEFGVESIGLLSCKMHDGNEMFDENMIRNIVVERLESGNIVRYINDTSKLDEISIVKLSQFVSSGVKLAERFSEHDIFKSRSSIV